MQIGWLAVLGITCGFLSADSPQGLRKYELQRAPEFLFQRDIGYFNCTGWPSDQPRRHGSYMTFSPRTPYRRTHLEEVAFSKDEIPSLIMTSDTTASVEVVGEARPDWSLQFCAKGDGDTDAEAQGHMQSLSMVRTGGMVSMAGRDTDANHKELADLLVHAPADAPANFYLNEGWIKAADTNAPLRVAAPRGRAKFLETTGRVDATAGFIDFAGAKGTVDLHSSSEMDLKMTATRFDGTLTAMAQRSLRVLMPPGFETSFQVIVSRREDFACRTDFCPRVKEQKTRTGLFIFTYAGSGDVSQPGMHLRSEDGPVVMDISTEKIRPFMGVHVN